MALKVLATDAQGALSEGDHTNDAFPSPARVGDVATITIAPPDGWGHAAYVVPGIAHAMLSLDGVTYGAEGADLTIGEFSASTTVYIKWASVAAVAPQLVLPAVGFVEIARVAGFAASDSAAVGDVAEVAPVEGVAASDSAAVGDATDGSTGATVEGFASSDSAAAGSATEVAPVGGVAASESAAVGNVTKTISAVALTTAAYFTDNFNRTNSSTLGGNWSRILGSTGRIFSNMYGASDNTENREKNTSVSLAEVTVTGVLVDSTVGASCQLMSRLQSDGSHYLGLFSTTTSNTKVAFDVYRFSGGGYTQIGTASAQLNKTTSGVCKFTVSGTGATVSFSGTYNGSAYTFTATDTSASRITAAGAVGIRMDTGLKGSVDDFTAYANTTSLTVTGLLSGNQASCNGGTNKFTESGGTATVTGLTAGTAYTVTVYDASNNLLATGTASGAHAGDTWTAS